MELYMRLQKRLHDMELILQKRFYVMDLYDVIKSFTWHGTLCFHGKEFYDVTKKGFISCNNMTLQKNVPRHGNYHITKKTICH